MMMDVKNNELISECEELLVLLKQLHKDTPILEKQHKSLKQAFVSAQAKLESTIESSDAEMERIKNKILLEFSNECKLIVSEVLSSSQTQIGELLKKIQLEKTKLESLSEQCIASTIKLMSTIDEAKNVLNELSNQIYSSEHALKIQKKQDEISNSKKTSSKKYIQFDYGEILSGAEIWKKYHDKTATPIIVQAPTWKGDYCYIITDYDEVKNQVKGRLYLNGKPRITKVSPNGRKTFTGKTDFFPYKSPNEKSIIDCELKLSIEEYYS